ncbi:hypothetical protein SO802_012428 [Lithocarpus litseifolius]|uniref:Uncharacterized protein n=1 Tax=Lithocarpus litseifolius TaxID=425828 RepID=A0AAW2D2Q1_9ROSI
MRVLYLVERVCYQLVGEDVPRVSMDPPQFILAPLSITDAEYQRNGIPYAGRLVDDLYYDEFNETCLMPSLIQEVDFASGGPVDPLHLPWFVYAYGLNGFAWERAVGCNTNFIGYLFPEEEHEELIWLAGNLKLEVSEYSRGIYDPEGFAHPGDDDDDDEGGDDGGAGGSKTTLSYQPRKRHHQ